jgi:hypothetical protein
MIKGSDRDSDVIRVDAKEQDAVSTEIIRLLNGRGVFDADTILLVGMTVITWGLSVARRDHGRALTQRRRAAMAEWVRKVELVDV